MEEQPEQAKYIWAFYSLKEGADVDFSLSQFRPFEPAINHALEDAIMEMASNGKYEEMKFTVKIKADCSIMLDEKGS